MLLLIKITVKIWTKIPLWEKILEMKSLAHISGGSQSDLYFLSLTNPVRISAMRPIRLS